MEKYTCLFNHFFLTELLFITFNFITINRIISLVVLLCREGIVVAMLTQMFNQKVEK